MRRMAVLGFLLSFLLAIACLGGFLFMKGWLGWAGVRVGPKDVSRWLEMNMTEILICLAVSAAVLLIVDFICLWRLAHPLKKDKNIYFEDEFGDVVIEISALENCLQRLVHEDPSVTWAQVTLDVPPPSVNRVITCDLQARMRVIDDLPGRTKLLKSMVSDRLHEMLPLERPLRVNVALRPEPEPTTPIHWRPPSGVLISPLGTASRPSGSWGKRPPSGDLRPREQDTPSAPAAGTTIPPRSEDAPRTNEVRRAATNRLIIPSVDADPLPGGSRPPTGETKSTSEESPRS